MNPQGQPTERVYKTVDPDILTQIIEQYEETARPFGKDEAYSEEDAKALGLPSPSMLNFLQKFVNKMVGTPFVPRWIAESPKPAGTMLACILRGREMDFKAMESLEVFWKAPDGRLSLYSKNMLSVMRKSGIKFEWLEDTPEGCQVKGVRSDGDTYTAHFSHEDALTAGLWDKNQSMHKKYPANMNRARCITMLWNTLAADLGGGPMYSREEVEEELRGQRNGASAAEPEQSPFVVSARPPEPKPPAREVPKQDSEIDRSLSSGDQGANASEAGASNPAVTEPSPAVKSSDANIQSGQTVEMGAAQNELSHTPPATEVKRGRGRPPKVQPISTQNPAGPSAAEETGYKATEDDVPAVIGSQPAAVPAPAQTPQKSQKERLDAIVLDLAGQFHKTTDQVKNVLMIFSRAFLNVSKLPIIHDPAYAPMLPILEELAVQYGPKLMSDPHGAGLESGAGWNALVRSIDKWPGLVQVWTNKAAVMRHPDRSDDILQYLQDVAEFADPHKQTEEMIVFLRVYLISRQAPMELKAACERAQKSMASVVATWGDVETMAESDILGRISELSSAGQDSKGDIWE